jgi:hypothetical protein
MKVASLLPFCFLIGTLYPRTAGAINSAELFTAESYRYGRFEARLRFAEGDGVVGSFFLWKDGSEISGTFWNELDFEKVGASCLLETNAFFGLPGAVHVQKHPAVTGICGDFHTYTFEWTPDYISFVVDGTEVRREVGATAAAYAENATAGMQIRFNVWPGDASFGGNFSPDILPVHQYVDWVQYSSHANGEFTVEWRDDFDAGPLGSRWLTGSWASPKNKSTHDPRNISIADGNAVLAITNPGGSSGVVTPTAGAGGGGGPGTGIPPLPSDEGGCSVGPARANQRGLPLVAAALGALAVFVRRGRRPARGDS